ncbi:MAG: hypothetical protein KFF50_02045 [Desulfatitalea sp.]|nr:hypothetical protein [Desulfatitalea sp.]
MCAHIFLCMLAYYVQWHMMEAWRPLLFADEQQENKKTRDPVSPAKRSDQALQKVATRQLDDGTAARSFMWMVWMVNGTPSHAMSKSGAAPTARQVAQRSADEQAVQRHGQFLDALHETALALIDPLDPHTLRQTILARATDLTGTRHGHVCLCDPGGEYIELREMDERKMAQKVLLRREVDPQAQSQHLEEVNTALRLLIQEGRTNKEGQ